MQFLVEERMDSVGASSVQGFVESLGWQSLLNELKARGHELIATEHTGSKFLETRLDGTLFRFSGLHKIALP
jgi:hypothetical protein